MQEFSRVLLLDIDHTVSDAFWRDHLVGAPGEPGTWEEYHSASWQDQPITEMIDLIKALSLTHYIIGLTTRPERWRKMTLEWLLKHEVPIDELLMRPDDNFTRAPELKIILAEQHLGGKLRDKVALAFDDREDVIAAYKAAGITALQVHAKRQPK